jgi:hypothetical protein
MEGHITPTILLMHAGSKSETSTMIETNPVKMEGLITPTTIPWSLGLAPSRRGGGPN